MNERSSRWNRPAQIALVAVVAVVLVVVLIWWQDRALVEAESRLQAGDPVGAAKTLDTFLSRRPSHQRGLLLKARTLVALQRWEQATQLFDQTGAQNAAELRAWATALLHQRQWSDALPLLEQVHAEDAADAETLRDLAVCRFQVGRVDAALESADQLAALPGHELDGLFQRGVIYGSLGQPHLAIECWEQIESRSPEAAGLPIPPAEFFRVYAEDLMMQARPRQALTYLQRGLTHSKKNSSSASQSPAQPRDPSGGKPDLDQQLHIEILSQLGQAWYQVDDHSQATQVWTETLQLDNDNLVARTGLADMALSEGDAEAALEWLTPISPASNATIEVAYLLQRAHTLLGHEEEAEFWQQRVATLRKSTLLQNALESRSSQP